MEKVYLDNAATTPVDKRVVEIMNTFNLENFGNPSSIHSVGVAARKAVEKAREDIATIMNAHAREIYFTSGGTESNNLAIFGTLKAGIALGKEEKSMHFVTTNIEHSSIDACLNELEKKCIKIDKVAVGEDGIIDIKKFSSILKSESVLVSICYANNEIGVIQPIKEIMKIVRRVRKENNSRLPYVHLDASQAPLYLNLNVEELGVDMMTIDGQKIYGPKGIGALYVRDGVFISPIMYGGGQERGLRPGTENVPAIVGFFEAMKIAQEMKGEESKRLADIRNYFFENLNKYVPEAKINGSIEERLPNNINIRIPGKDSEFLVLRLDEKGFICSSRSACNSELESSHVIKALLKEDKKLENESSSLRFTMGRNTKKEDIKNLLITLSQI